MIKKLYQNLSEKAEIEFWLSSQRANLQNFLVFLTVLFIPTQLGLHFWPEASFIKGIRIDYLSPTIYFSDILIITLLLSFLSKSNTNHFKNLLLGYLKNSKILAVLTILLLGVLLSKNPFFGAYSLIKVLELFLFTLVIAKNIQKNNLRFIVPALAIGILFESVIAMLQFYNQGSLNGALYLFGERTFVQSTPNIANASIGGELVLRPYGTFSHPNVLAGYLVISMLALILHLSRKVKESLPYYLVLFLGTVALVLTLSRVSMFVWLILLGFIFLRKVKPILIALGGLLLMFLLFPQAVNRFRETSLSDSSFAERIELSFSSIKMIYENPIFGTGLGNFLNNLPDYYARVGQIILIQPVHNIPLLLVSQIGLIAGGLVAYFAVLLFRITNRTGKYLLLALLGLGLFDHYLLTLQQGQLLLALVLGIAIGGMIRSNHGRSNI